ncbi:type II toxin-antitoxin system RatA family toxin [Oricola thermophila]|uniref:Type II toxin-antitoxin system RatA family toxin n=1 Tax=Oricola thermophila TaxID=2742145 RepID=A0A6N1VGA1_9HYPH|nr:type II toxin-antitoxin system RatA family toxin [Oricola thermophila]QKV18179.1 type II toxin-antitoxin system RatA family toxin [Oricola thermophila]
MPKFQDTTPVPHSAAQMFELVADIERYPEFLPMCEALRIRDRRERDGKTMLVADMTVGYKMVRETFTTQVLLKPDELAIDVSYVDGPFRYLDNRWRFEDRLGGGSNVHFCIDYEFRNRALGMLMGAMFDKAFHMFSQAFRNRAVAIYGDPERTVANA